MLRFEGDNDHLQHVLEWLDNFERGAEVELVVRLPRGGSAISAGFSRSETVADVLAYLNKFAPIERVGLPGSRFLEHSTTLDFLAPRAVLVSESSLERKPPPEKKTVDIKRRENHRNERKEALKEREATLKNFYADHQR